MNVLTITYRFRFPSGIVRSYQVRLDATHLTFIDDCPADQPEWTRLTCHQCPHCPLFPELHPKCPLAARLAPVTGLFRDVISYENISLEVVTAKRVITHQTTAQRAVSALMGVVIACSGCPHTGYFRPMARFHLPLADKQETIYRSASMYLLAQYFRFKENSSSSFSLSGLEKIYADMQTVNLNLVKRLRQYDRAESNINAIVLLDAYAMAIPFVLDESLEEIRPLFASYLDSAPAAE